MRARPKDYALLVLALSAAATVGLGTAALVPPGGPATSPAARPVSAGTGIETAPPAPIEPLAGPWVVAVQPGHWEVENLPDELARLRTSTGAEHGTVREVDLNRAVAAALIERIEAKGWKALLVPATVPPGLRADAFLSIHADWSSDPGMRGWKLAASWRSSGASRALLASLSEAFGGTGGLPRSPDAATVNMRGYFAFNSRRFEHASSPYTPAALLELGFLTNEEDRTLMKTNPSFYADVIVKGLERYFAGRERSRTDDLRPLDLPWVAAGPAGAVVRRSPEDASEALWTLEPDSVLLPVDESGGWYEVFVRKAWATGWVRKAETVPAEDPRWPMPGETRPSAQPLPAAENAGQ